MSLLLVHVRAQTTELLRFPAYSIPALLFPTALFVLFAAPADDADPEVAATGFAAIAVLGVVFFQFGVGIAAERANPWEAYVRTLPVIAELRIAARVVSGLVFAAASVGLLLVVALAATDLSFAAREWARFAAALALGAVPFALFGIALGYLVPARAALPVANLLFLPLSFVGGLWGGAEHLPEVLDEISPFLPTRQWGELLGTGTGAAQFGLHDVLGLAAYSVAFAFVAAWAYRRDEGERYT